MNPTVVLTEMGRKAWSNPEKAATILDRTPLGKNNKLLDEFNTFHIYR